MEKVYKAYIKFDTEQGENTKSSERWKNYFYKRIGRKCRPIPTRIEQNNDHTRLMHGIQFRSFFKEYRWLRKMIHQIDSKSEWLLLSARFTAKFELVFVLTLENDFSYRFHFKANRKSKGSSKKRYLEFPK